MYSKYKIQKIVDKYSRNIIKLMGMKKFRIKLHIYHSHARYIKEKGLKVNNLYGISYISEDGADIILFYDQIENEERAIGTLIHELLHVRLHTLTNLVTLYVDRAGLREEYLVRQLQVFIMTLIDYKKLDNKNLKIVKY